MTEAEPKLERTSRRTFIGLVTSDKMMRTITVQVDRLVQHPVFKKYMRKSSTYKAHDEKREAKIGDRVEIAECRPLSKTKRFRLVRIVSVGSIATHDAAVGGGK